MLGYQQSNQKKKKKSCPSKEDHELRTLEEKGFL